MGSVDTLVYNAGDVTTIKRVDVVRYGTAEENVWRLCVWVPHDGKLGNLQNQLYPLIYSTRTTSNSRISHAVEMSYYRLLAIKISPLTEHDGKSSSAG